MFDMFRLFSNLGGFAHAADPSKDLSIYPKHEMLYEKERNALHFFVFIFETHFTSFLGRFEPFGGVFGVLWEVIWSLGRSYVANLASFAALLRHPISLLCRFGRFLIARSALGRRFWTHVEAQMGRF